MYKHKTLFLDWIGLCISALCLGSAKRSIIFYLSLFYPSLSKAKLNKPPCCGGEDGQKFVSTYSLLCTVVICPSRYTSTVL